MRLKIKGLVSKKTAGGIRFYWEPSPTERKAGWTGFPAGTDLVDAARRAEARNAEIEAWRNGGASPRAVKKFFARTTFGHLLKRYMAERLPQLADSTQRTAGTALRRLETWGGDMQLTFITRARVKKLRDAMMQPLDKGGIGHHAAFAVLEQGRTVFQWGIGEEIVADNPFTSFGLGKPDPRDQIWEQRHADAYTAAAIAKGMPSIALSIEIGLYIGQRQGDILKLGETSWREIPRNKFRMDPRLYDQLAHADGPDAGKVMGLYVRQGKTKRWVGIPIEGDMRRRIEAAIAANQERGKRDGAIAVTTLLVCERTGLPWNQDDFIHRFGDVRKKAIEIAIAAGDVILAAELEKLEYRDLRRSCVVVLGELGLDDAAIGAITGHKLATIKAMLEIYMPRTEGMAARAVVARIGDRRPTSADVKEEIG